MTLPKVQGGLCLHLHFQLYHALEILSQHTARSIKPGKWLFWWQSARRNRAKEGKGNPATLVPGLQLGVPASQKWHCRAFCYLLVAAVLWTPIYYYSYLIYAIYDHNLETLSNANCLYYKRFSKCQNISASQVSKLSLSHTLKFVSILQT